MIVITEHEIFRPRPVISFVINKADKGAKENSHDQCKDQKENKFFTLCRRRHDAKLAEGAGACHLGK
jgi:hypothetical protein